MATLREVQHADGKMQIEVTSFGQSDLPQWTPLRAKMNKLAKQHFKGKPFAEVADQEVPQSVVTVFNKMCDAAERRCHGYIACRL